MLSTLYALVAVISFVQLISLLIKGGKNQNVYMLLLFAVTLICNIGYYAISVSESVETAVLCNKITYFGGIFLPLFVLLSISDLCKTKLPKALMIFLVIYSFVVLTLAFSVGHNGIYYKQVGIERIYGITRLIKTYGPTHFTYQVLLYGELGIALYVVIRALRTKKNFSKKTVSAILAIVMMPIIVYALDRIFHWPIDILPFVYILFVQLFLMFGNRIRMYDITSSVADSYEIRDEYGYIVFDLKKRFINCNKKAIEIFPELKKVEVDKRIEEEDTLLYKEIVQWLNVMDAIGVKEKEIWIGERFIKCYVHKIRTGLSKHENGYNVELIDNTKQQKYISLINNYNVTLEKEVKEKTEHVRVMQESIITGMASVMESRDDCTGGHIRRTSKCVKVLVEALEAGGEYDVPESFWTDVTKAAPMHDLGKIAVADELLHKPGRYVDEEYERMKKHAEKGAEIVAEVLREVKDTAFVEIAINVANYHHEKWDGTGYPAGLKETEIPLEARIMALADVFDVLVSKRSYKEAYDYDKAFQIIEESLGSHFDPELGEVFMSCRNELEALYDSMKERCAG